MKNNFFVIRKKNIVYTLPNVQVKYYRYQDEGRFIFHESLETLFRNIREKKKNYNIKDNTLKINKNKSLLYGIEAKIDDGKFYDFQSKNLFEEPFPANIKDIYDNFIKKGFIEDKIEKPKVKSKKGLFSFIF